MCDIEEPDDQVILIHCLVVELPDEAEAYKTVKSFCLKIAKQHEAEKPSSFVGQKYVQLWVSM